MPKCKYAYCNNLGVCTEEYVKVGKTYYCKLCYEEKEMKAKIKDKIAELLPMETMLTINSTIKDLVHTRKIDSKYILYVLEDIEVHKRPLRYARGLIYFCNNAELLDIFNKIQTNKKYKQMLKEPLKEDDANIPIFNKPSDGESTFTDLI